jgi:hypothetical protein
MLEAYELESDPEEQPRLLFKLNIDVGDNSQKSVAIYSNTNIKQLVTSFVREFNLNDDAIPVIVNTINANLK